MKRRKNQRVSKLTVDTINARYYGAEEPSLKKGLGTQLNWYNAMADDDHAKAWLIEWLANNQEYIKLLKQVPKDWMPRTAAWLARLDMRGYSLTQANHDYIDKQLLTAFEHIVVVSETPKEKNAYVPNVQERIREKASDFVANIEGMIDDKTISPAFSLYDHLRSIQASGPMVKRLIEHFGPVADELINVIVGDDKQLVEGYKKYSETEREDMAVMYQSMIDDANRYIGNVKATRAPRKKKSKSKDKIVKSLKFAKNNEDLQIMSIDPTKIVGAQELWVFNQKNNLLSVFRGNGLGVKGTSIVDYDEKNSFSKTIGRKTKDVLNQVLNNGKVALRNLMKDEKTVRTNRMNNATILLKVS